MTVTPQVAARPRRPRATSEQQRIIRILTCSLRPECRSAWLAPNGDVYLIYVPAPAGPFYRQIEPSGITHSLSSPFTARASWSKLDLSIPKQGV